MLTPQDHELVASAIREAEARTDGEVSVVVAPDSDSYNDVTLHWTILFTLLPLAFFASFPGVLAWVVSLLHEPWAADAPPLRLIVLYLLLKTAGAFVVGWLIFRIPRVKHALTPHATKARRVRRRAILIFQVGTEKRTASRTGVLLYLSLAEHRAEIVADATIQARVSGEEWGEAMIALLQGVKAGKPGEGIAAAVRQIGDVLATYMPHTGTDPNELPDRLIQL